MAQEIRTTGTDPEHNRQIILDAYETFRRANSVMANLACDKEGENWLAKMVGKRERIKIGYIIMRISIMSPKS